MKYLLLIYDREEERHALPPDDRAQLTGEYIALVGELRAAGHYLAGNSLQPTTTATSVRVRSGKSHLTDGPFAETREQLGGFLLIEAKDLDEATRIAAQIPGAKVGTIEVRPVVAM